MYEYADTVQLPDELTLGTLRELEDHFRGLGEVGGVGPVLEFRFEAEDLWELRGIADEASETLSGYGICWVPERKRVTVATS